MKFIIHINLKNCFILAEKHLVNISNCIRKIFIINKNKLKHTHNITSIILIMKNMNFMHDASKGSLYVFVGMFCYNKICSFNQF